MMNFNVYIFDDDAVQLEALKSKVRSRLGLLGYKFDIETAPYPDAAMIVSGGINTVTLVFMDIEYEDGKPNGLENAEKIRAVCPKALIVFVTGYANEYFEKASLQIIKKQAYWFITKPVSDEYLASFFTKITKHQNKTVFTMNTKQGTFSHHYSEIVHVTSEHNGKNILLHFDNGQTKVYSMNLKHFGENMPESFFRVSNQQIVNLDFVDRIVTDENAKTALHITEHAAVIEYDGKTDSVHVTRSHYKDFVAAFHRHKGGAV